MVAFLWCMVVGAALVIVSVYLFTEYLANLEDHDH